MSTEFEEKVTKRTQVYRDLGQGLKIFHEHPRAEVECVCKLIHPLALTLTWRQHLGRSRLRHEPSGMLDMDREQQRGHWTFQTAELTRHL